MDSLISIFKQFKIIGLQKNGMGLLLCKWSGSIWEEKLEFGGVKIH